MPKQKPNHHVTLPHMEVSHDTLGNNPRWVKIQLFAPHDELSAEIKVVDYSSGKILLILRAEDLMDMVSTNN